MKEFVFAAKATIDEDGKEVEGPEEPSLKFMVDGEEYTCYRPSDGQMVLIMAAMSGYYSSTGEAAATMVNFFVELLDDDSKHRVTRRLMDRTDPFGLDALTELLEWVVETWSNTPTSGPSGSTSSPESTGPKSTAAVLSKESTPSDSDQTVFATSSTPG